uniref:Uncharacterized protein n=1 Tax=Timema genevievae TaxID=629358 RepID=A0A7R9JZD0_TIMGE|nr:unnamed protein product [Timema genevievae]
MVVAMLSLLLAVLVTTTAASGALDAAQEVSVQRVFQQMLKIRPPQVATIKSIARPPRHMLDLYHKYLAGRGQGRNFGNTVRNIVPKADKDDTIIAGINRKRSKALGKYTTDMVSTSRTVPVQYRQVVLSLHITIRTVPVQYRQVLSLQSTSRTVPVQFRQVLSLHTASRTVPVQYRQVLSLHIARIGRGEFRGSEAAFAWRESGKLLRKNHPQFTRSEIRTSISPSSVVELNTTSALSNYATEAGTYGTNPGFEISLFSWFQRVTATDAGESRGDTKPERTEDRQTDQKTSSLPFTPLLQRSSKRNIFSNQGPLVLLQAHTIQQIDFLLSKSLIELQLLTSKIGGLPSKNKFPRLSSVLILY